MRTNSNILDIVNDVLAWDLSEDCISDAVSVHAGHMAGWDAQDEYGYDMGRRIH